LTNIFFLPFLYISFVQSIHYKSVLSSLLKQGYTDIKSQYPVSVMRWRGCCGRDRMVVRFTTTYAISDYHH